MTDKPEVDAVAEFPPVEPIHVELFGQDVTLWEFADWTPHQQLKASDIMGRLTELDEDDRHTRTELVLELGLVLTHAPEFKKPVSLDAFRRMYKSVPRHATEAEREKVREYNNALMEEVVSAGTAVTQMLTATSKRVAKKPRPAAAKKRADKGK